MVSHWTIGIRFQDTLSDKIRAAELLNSLPDDETPSQEEAHDEEFISPVFSPNQDPEEAALEAKEVSKYLFAKSLFDCREYDRCAAAFLPESLLTAILTSRPDGKSSTPNTKGKAKAGTTANAGLSGVSLPNISQKSLFLALYAKFMSGEKRKDEDSEMVMGPQDLGTVVNKQLVVVSRYLNAWFQARTTEDGEVVGSQGWLEYLYVSPFGTKSTAANGTCTGTAWFWRKKRTTRKLSVCLFAACTSTP